MENKRPLTVKQQRIANFECIVCKVPIAFSKFLNRALYTHAVQEGLCHLCYPISYFELEREEEDIEDTKRYKPLMRSNEN